MAQAQKPKRKLGPAELGQHRAASAVDASNAQILADRQKRIDAQRKVLPDLGLKLPEPEPEPDTASAFMDQFDKKAFGTGDQATITKIIYGPDPLVDNSPTFREALEMYGREDLAHGYEEAIMKKGASAMPDPLMAKAMEIAIHKFGREAIAAAFRDRVLKIPYRTVEIDASDDLDPEILGSAILEETVKRHRRPGMEYRFFTQLCVDRLGWRGYTPVKENGDIVKAGTLMLGEMRREKVEARRRKQQEMAREKLEGIAEKYEAGAENALAQQASAGLSTQGIAPLGHDEILTATHAGGEDPEGYLGRSRAAGIEIGRES
ncbi:MAG TPA: hypothetical protein VN776_11410 [Terracidiphilus sp.]|nr:hypothetical protein [Terracidiphilus sp.]